MGKKTTIALVGGLAVIAAITAMQDLGSNLQDEFAAVEPQSQIAAAAPEPVIPSAAAAQPSGLAREETMLEQAILDAFPASKPKSATQRKRSSNAKDFVAASINAQGYLCADPVEMRKADPGQYGIGCVMNRNGTGAAIYLLDARTGSVMPIG